MDQLSYNNEPGWRKRHLSDNDPDGCEFMPLSKRINNLHLNGSNLNADPTPTYTPVPSPACECRLQPSTSSSVVQCSLCNPNLYGITRQALPLPDLINIPNEIMMQREKTHGNHRNPQHIGDETYSPDMDVLSNPHYYTPNKLLFDLHIERVKRHGLLFKPNKYDG